MTETTPVVVVEKAVAVIGLGGGGGWLVQLFSKSNNAGTTFWLIDGDTVETKNLNRQMFTQQDVGKPKVQNMARILTRGVENPPTINCHPEFLAFNNKAYNELLDCKQDLYIMVCVDNHPARRLCLHLADERHELNHKTVVIIAANEYEAASAQTYLPNWKDTPLDPRIMFPEIMTDDEGDPLTPPCSGEELISSPQLALSNLISATSAAWLLRFWSEVQLKFLALDVEEYKQLRMVFPVIVDWTDGRQRTIMLKDLLPPPAPPPKQPEGATT